MWTMPKLARRLAPLLLAVVVGLGLLAAARLAPLPAEARPGDAAGLLTPGLAGTARVLDGDTLEIGGTRIRLEGIDAPETGQTCQRPGYGLDLGRGLGNSSRAWDCGTAATKALAQLTDRRRVECQSLGLDKYGRALGLCRADGRDLNAELVRQGLAWAFVRYSNRYVAEEAEARAAKRGVWAADNTPPWEHRAGTWHAAEAGAPAGCAIKGNVTRQGRIYHMPWNSWYGRVKIDPAQGERWFCNEAEAVAAGWRSAR